MTAPDLRPHPDADPAEPSEGTGTAGSAESPTDVEPAASSERSERDGDVPVEDVDGAADRPRGLAGLARSGRLADLSFGAYVAIALPVLVFVIGAQRWFLRDEWFFLAGRSGSNLSGLMAPHNEHWSTVPILVYRVLYKLFGVHTYSPYVAAVAAIHLTSCVLLFVLLRRARINPWIAAAAAATFVLYGTGEENIVWGFQVGMAGSVMFGLAQMVCVDVDGGLRRRDALGLLFGLLSLMSSGVGTIMVVAVGVTTLVRRGWRVAAGCTAPLGAAYGAWFLVQRPETSPFGRPPISTSLDWVKEGARAVFAGISANAAVAVVLALAMIGGIVLLALELPWAELRRRLAMPLGLGVGLPLFYATTSLGRWFVGVAFTESSRYVYVATLFVLPLVAVAIDAYVRRWRWALAPGLLLLLAGVPGNISRFNGSFFNERYYDYEKAAILGSAYSPLADTAPEWVLPEPDVFNGPDLTIGWLREARDAGTLPPPPDLSPSEKAAADLRLSLAVARDPKGTFGSCREGGARIDLHLKRNDKIKIRSVVNVRMVDGKDVSDAVPFRPQNGDVLQVVVDSLDVRINTEGAAGQPAVCLS